MTPYYEEDGIVIYHGDCREVLPKIGAVDHVVTDPPWRTSDRGVSRTVPGSVGVRRRESRGIDYGDIGEFDADSISVALSLATSDSFIVCGYKELEAVLGIAKPLRGVFGWHKPNGCPTNFYPARMDLAFVVWSGATSSLYGREYWPSMVFRVSRPAAGCFVSERIVDEGGKSLHPAQGPVALYSELIRPLTGVILDPYMGTGTTLVAAKRLGRRAVGIEIEERYCEIATKRLAQGVLPLIA